MSKGLPNGWAETPLETLAAKTRYPIGDGDHGKIKPATYTDRGIPYIRVADMGWGEFEPNGLVYIPEKVHEQNLKSDLRPGDVLIAKTGATIGKCCIVPESIPRANTTASVGKITVNREATSSEWILNYFLSREFKSQMWAVSEKTAQPGFNIHDLKKFIIPVAPLNEQRRIVPKLEKLLSSVNACQRRLTKIPVMLKRFRQSVLAAASSGRLTVNWREEHSVGLESGHVLLARIRKDRLENESGASRRQKLIDLPKPYQPHGVELPVIPPSWAWASLAEIGAIITGKTPSKKNAGYWNGDVPFVMPEDLAKSDESLCLKEVTETTNRVTEQGLNTVQHLDSPAVLVCCIGTLGRVGYIRARAAFSQQLNAILPHPDLNLEYVAFYCHTIEPILRELWPQNTYMPIVNKTLFSSVPIPIPPVLEQGVLVKELKQKLEEQSAMERSGEKGKALVDILYDSILTKAFRGELVPQDPNDEPASVLLERIRQERNRDDAEPREAKSSRLSRRAKSLR